MQGHFFVMCLLLLTEETTTEGKSCTNNQFGNDCLDCNCMNKELCTDNGRCSHCKDGWAGPTCQIQIENIAYGKNAVQGPITIGFATAGSAIDGNRYENSSYAWAQGDNSTGFSWWRVDLEDMKEIYEIVIWLYRPGNCIDSSASCKLWAGQGECDTNHAFMAANCRKSCNKCQIDKELEDEEYTVDVYSVMIGNTTDTVFYDNENDMCYNYTTLGKKTSVLIFKNCASAGRYVTVFYTMASPAEFANETIDLQLTEVQILASIGCSSGTYGPECDKECTCGDKLKCDRVTGSCKVQVCSKEVVHVYSVAPWRTVETRYCVDDVYCRHATDIETCENSEFESLCISHFDCGDGRCIASTNFCDGEADCTSGVDERQCFSDCTRFESFHCDAENEECISHKFICDGYPHCSNGFDEQGCDLDVMDRCKIVAAVKKYDNYYIYQEERKLDQRSCLVLTSNQMCETVGGNNLTIGDEGMQHLINAYFVPVIQQSYYISRVVLGLNVITGNFTHADFVWDDGSPLTYTAWKEPIKLMHGDDTCFFLLNDNRWDSDRCVYGTEERSATMLCYVSSNYNITQPRSIVHDVKAEPMQQDLYAHFLCHSGEVISSVFVCDQVNDCSDNSDELDCDNADNTFFDNDYICDDGTRINIGLWCDNSHQCPDQSDEATCVPVPCSEYEWRCANGECIHQDLLCDNSFHCQDRSDESFKACNGYCKERDLYQCTSNCPSTQRCIRRSLTTDGIIDCEGDTPLPKEQVIDICSKEHDGRYFVDLGEDLYGTLAVSCVSDGFTIGFKVDTFVEHFDSRNDITVVSLRYGSDYLIQRLINVSTICYQDVRVTSEKDVIVYHSSDRHTFAYVPKGFPAPDCTMNNSACLVHCNTANKKWFCNETDTTEGKLITRTLQLDNITSPILTVVLKGRSHTYTSSVTCQGPFQLPFCESMDCSTVGSKMYSRHRCLLNIKPDGSPFGCRDMSHLDNCGNFSCPDNYVKCPNSFCLNTRLVCDGQPHCPHGEDEIDCDMYICKGMFSCRGSRSCVPQEMVCDNLRQCRFGDDELYCSFECPPLCECHGVSVVKCNVNNPGTITSPSVKFVRMLDVSNSLLHSMHFHDLEGFRLLSLILSNSGILTLESNISSSPFQFLINLRKLDLSDNLFERVHELAFKGIDNLKVLNLNGNSRLTHIDEGSFIPLKSLITLHIAHTGVSFFMSGTFLGLGHLEFLDVRSNRLHITTETLKPLSGLSSLDIRGAIIETETTLLNGNKKLELLKTESPALCCLIKKFHSGSTCLAPENPISSCDNLIRSGLHKMCYWILGLSAVLGNMLAIVYRLYKRRWDASTVLLTFLSLSDMLMGLSTITVASADVYFSGDYISHDFEWRKGPGCTFAGISATISTEASALLLCMVIIERYISNRYRYQIAPGKIPILIALVSYTTATLIAIIPILIETDLGESLYSRSGLCSPVPLNVEDKWRYFIGLVINLNLIIYITAGVVYVLLCINVRTMSKSTSGNANITQIPLAYLAVVIVTEFSCWLSISILGFAIFGGTNVSSDVYVFVMGFLLLLSSAMNPCMHTLFTASIKTTKDAVSANMFMKIYNTIGRNGHFIPVNNQTTMPLSRFVVNNCVSTKSLQLIKARLTEYIDLFHENHFCHGQISEDTITVIVDGNKIVDVHLEFRHKQQPTETRDSDRDIDDMLQLLNRLASDNTEADDGDVEYSEVATENEML